MKGNDGKEIPNPFRDARVRRAISKAIDRNAIVERVMEGSAVPASQMLPEGFFGYSPKLSADAYDPEGARKLLAEAGHPDGFQLTIHGSNDRYLNDAKIVETIAQMLTRIGVKTSVATLPGSVYFGKASALEFSLMFVGYGSDTGEGSAPLKALLATFDKAAGMGAFNRGRYSNPKFDATLKEALATIDAAKREKLLQKAGEIGIGDLGVIPLHNQINTWALRKGLAYLARTDENTLADGVSKVK